MATTSFSEIFSAITVFVLIALLGAAGFVVSQKMLHWTEDMKEHLRGRGNIDISNSSVRIGVKSVSNEEERDKLQRAFVRTMSNSHVTPAMSTEDKHHRIKR